MKVIKFNAIWCSACLVMKKVYREIEIKYPELEVINYDYDEDTEMVEKYHIGSTIPVLIFLDENNEEITRLVGEKKFNEIEDAIISISRGR